MERKRAITIKDVAAEAGVSFQTVSRVINKGPNVTPAMHARVTAAIAKLGYVPSLAARRLGGSRSYLIVALNDRQPTIEGWQARRGNDWIDQMLLGGMLACAERGYYMLFDLIDAHAEGYELQVQSVLSSLHPDGIILTPPHSENDAVTGLLRRNGVPFARMGSHREGDGFAVHMDDRAAARHAVDYLAGLGHRRIGFVQGNAEYSVSADRLTGFREAIALCGFTEDPDYVQPGDFTYEAGVAAMNVWARLPAPPTAVLASSGESALGVLHAAPQLGLSVPRDLSVVSFDDTPTVRMSVPAVTAVRQPISAMAGKAAELLIDASLNGYRPVPPIEVPFEFMVRESTAPPR